MPISISRTGENLTLVENTNIHAAVPALISVEALNGFVQTVLAHDTVKPLLAAAQHRVISVHADEPLSKDASTEVTHWVTTIADYTNNRTLLVRADFPAAGQPTVTVSGVLPLPSFEEWKAAADLVAKDTRFAKLVTDGTVTPYQPMPPLLEEPLPTGEPQRLLYVGLLPKKGSRATHQIVGVNMRDGAVTTFQDGSPANSNAGPTSCGVAPSGCSSPARGTAGQAWVSWPAQNPVWKFLVVRPAASSGTRGSGIELRFVDFKGKRVLYQAHVPILNVQYEPGGCGTYRDWQYQEHCFQCDGVDLAPGIRWANAQPKTICESGNDNGNFTGVGIHDNGEYLSLVTVMSAGWYRYIQEWRLFKNGNIQPLFKFGATTSSCVCHAHHHHCYWRLDLDLNSPGNNLVEEFNDPPIIPNTNWHKKVYEIRRFRDPAHKRKWRVSNIKTHEMYEIQPGATDGVADAFGRGDLWVLRYHPGEIDDGYNQTSGPGDPADINKFINGELVEGQDVVVWYAAHFRHIVDPNHPEVGCEVLGPLLKLIKW